MKKNILKYGKMIPIIILVLMFLVSCGSRTSVSDPVTVTETKEIKEIVRDTIVWVEKDSVQSIIQIDCLDKSNPQIKTINKRQGRILKPPQLTLQGNKLTIDCKAEAEQLALKLYDKYIKEHKKQVLIKEIEKPFKWYHKTLMWLGGIALLFTIIGFVVKKK